MPRLDHEQTFWKALRDLFVGAEVEGQGGFINLLRIKSRYYERGAEPRLRDFIDERVIPGDPFREELFEKLFSFFKRYFSESGSIYYRYTFAHDSIYEQVYSDRKDVALFYKTHMLYYVKTDRLFKCMNTEVDGFKFHFDANSLENKKSNEKREVIFEFSKVEDGVIWLRALYSERGRTTKSDEILKGTRNSGLRGLNEETLEKAIGVFLKQSEADYFINKDARKFLREQFELWLYQYVFGDQETEWNEARIKQLQILRDVAYKVIDFIPLFAQDPL